MAALHWWFEDPLAEHKARTWMKTITQGRWSVAEYTQEFCEMACQLATWPEEILVECFEDGLTNEVYYHWWKFPLPAQEGLGALTPLEKNESNSDNDLLVSQNINPMIILVELVVSSSGTQGRILDLLDSGCTRYVPKGHGEIGTETEETEGAI